MVRTCVQSSGAADGSSDGAAGALGSSDGEGSADGEALGDGLALGDGSPDAVSGSRVRMNAITRPATIARATTPTMRSRLRRVGAGSVVWAESVIGIFLRCCGE